MKKIKMSNQLTLGVSLKDDATFANFYLGSNEHLVTTLKKSAQSDGERIIYFYGNSGSGCTHLLQAACHEAHKHRKSTVYIPLSHLAELTPDIFEGLENLQLICIDDIHRLAGNRKWEEAFFHIYNRTQDSGSYLMISANAPPKSLGLALPDVLSRLEGGMVFHLQPVTDHEKLLILIMRAERRGLTLSEEVGRFILNHCPRHMSTLFAALDTLDKVSLTAQRKLTIPFVKKVLQI